MIVQIQKERFTCFIKILFFAFYILWVAVGIINHEAWRDEGQAWLIARDLGWGQIFLQAGVEGHPFLWFYILKPFTVFPFYPTLFFINAFFVFSGVFLLLFRLELPYWFTIPFIILSALFYEIPIVARGYGCAFFLSILALVFYEKRFQKPLLYSLILGFLMNITVVGAVVGAILLLYFYYEIIEMKTKNKLTIKYPMYQKSLIVGLIFLGLIGLQIGMMFLKRGPMSLAFLQTIPLWIIPIGVLLVICSIFLFYKRLWENPLLFSGNDSIKLVLQTLLLGICLTLYCIAKIPSSVRVTFGIGMLFLYFQNNPLKNVFALIYISIIIGGSLSYMQDRQVFIFFLMIILLIPKTLEKKSNQHYLYLGIMLVVTFISFYYTSIYSYMYDLRQDSSGSKKAAQYIKDNQWDNKEEFLLVVHDTAAIVGAIAPLFNEKIFYFPFIETYGSVIDWILFHNRQRDTVSLIKNIESKNNDKIVIYLSSNVNLDRNTWKQLTNFPGSWENVVFYQLEKTIKNK